MKKRAILSVSDKSGIVEFAKRLQKLGYEIISTGGTERALLESGLEVTNISDITGFPECLDGRVKTLHPNVHAGILAMRSNPEHMAQLKKLNITPIDVVAINLYPFRETISKPGVELPEAIENIDIGGPTMIRAAAKNWQDVTVIVDPTDYPYIIEQLSSPDGISLETKFKLACKVFEHTASYDAMIINYLRKEAGFQSFPATLTMTYERVQDLRYGENPHQKAAFYRELTGDLSSTIAGAYQMQGKELSFNNINDANGAIALLKEYAEPCAVAVKHTNPCGVGTGETIYDAYQKAYASDPVSIFGGIVALNREVDEKTAKALCEIFLEIVIAPSFTREARAVFKEKKNLRVLEVAGLCNEKTGGQVDMKKVEGGLLIQSADDSLYNMDDLKVVTDREPTEAEMEQLLFAWKVVKHTKSNAIVLAKENATIGVGPGQTNRIEALEIALRYAKERAQGSVMASDAFFPFPDCVERAKEAGITAIIQPGGSIKDQESIDAANKAGIAMIFTGQRHFKH